MKIHGTAKGGAISKKDFGVAFASGGGGTPCEFDYSYICGIDSNAIGGSYDQLAIRNMKGVETTVATATWYLHKRGTITGNAQCHMYEADGTTKSASSDFVDVSVVTAEKPSVGQPIVFTFSPAVTWADEYWLAIEYSGGDDTLGVSSSYTTACGDALPTDIICYYWVNASSSWAALYYPPSPGYVFYNCITACS